MPRSASCKGQMFEPFNLLIGAIIALMMLAIIVGAVNYFDKKRLEVSSQKLDDGIANAVRQPNGQPLLVKEILLQEGTSMASHGVSSKTGLKEECISFDSGGVSGLTVSGSPPGSLLNVEARVLVNVIVTCTANPSQSCEVGCIISFESAA
ncbi:Uncharacterised protein [uncultured archaeon]|nr:Uncharacterised protein [uncultured archaeon]